jgi:transcription elongation factor GreA
MSDQMYLTSAGAHRLKEELELSKGKHREDIAKRLRAAIQQGDLSENADYHKAKEDQSFLEGRIQELEYVLKNAIIVEAHEGARDKVEIGVQVTVQEGEFLPETYLMVGIKEADPSKGRISHESPIGKVLMGSHVGDVVIAETPGGQVQLKVIRIE